MKRKCLICVIALLTISFVWAICSNKANAAEYYNDEIYYNESWDGTIEVVAAGKFIENASIPSKINGKTVTSIGNFSDCTHLKTVSIPSTVTSFGYGSFEGCTSLTSINIPSSITRIEPYTFKNCSSLKTISLPNSITEIGYSAFQGCSSLTSITIPSKVTQIQTSTFSECKSLKGINIHSNIREILGSAFENCTSLTNVYIPSTVTSISGGWSNGIFEGCTSLKKANIQANVKEIPAYMFEKCTALTDVTLTNTMVECGDGVFLGCSSLKTISLPINLREIGRSMFENCKNLTTVNMPDTILTVDAVAFQNCTSLTTINLPVRQINGGWSNGVFEGCNNLKTVYFSKKIQEIDSYTFNGINKYQLTIYGYAGTAAKTFASQNNYNYIECQPVTSVTVSGYNTIIMKKTTKLISTINPYNAYNKSVKWTSSDSSIASVDYYTGVVTANKPGNVTITATAMDGTGVKGTYSITVRPSDLSFNDVKVTDWFYESVKYVSSNNIIKGYNATTFAPRDNLTRGMMVTILYRLENYPTINGKPKFPDVQDSNQYYYQAVKWATDKKIVSGYSNGKFGPKDNITREQLAVILNNYANYKKKNTNVINDLSKFKDKNAISSYAVNQMKWAVGAGVISGNSDGTLNPQGKATRAEVSAMLENFRNKVK